MCGWHARLENAKTGAYLCVEWSQIKRGEYSVTGIGGSYA